MKKLKTLVLLIVLAFVAFVVAPLVTAQSAQENTFNKWVVDPEVTFIGKGAAQAGELFDWALANYTWMCADRVVGQCQSNPKIFTTFLSFTFPVALLIAIILLYITGKKPFSPKDYFLHLGFWTVIITVSFFFVKSLYEITDYIQGYLLAVNPLASCPPACLTQKDLLFVGWPADQFIGLRLNNEAYAESAFTSLLLVKLTSLTYYIMAGALFMRKVILWFFLIGAPIMALLMLHKPIRNIGKVITAEFLLWLLYAPLLVLFLQITSFLWRNGIPSSLASGITSNQIFFPTAVNILIGGPGQIVTPTNNINIPETFLLYVVSVVTLMIIIILPWVILRVFVDYFISSLSAIKQQLPK